MADSLSPAEIKALRESRYNATLAGLTRVHSDLAIFRIKPDFPFPPHKAGQYTTLGLGNWEPRCPGCAEEELQPADLTRIVRRAYSISHPILGEDDGLSTADPNAIIEFYIVLVRELEVPGAPALTPRLFLLREGDRLQMGEKITGHYTLDPVTGDQDVILLATGTGEAPHNYKVWELLRRGHRGRVLSACCVRYGRDLAYLAVHEKLMRRYPNYRYLPLTTREGGPKRYIQDLITSGELEQRLGKPLDPSEMHVFLCGNPAMIGIPHVNRETGAHEYPSPVGVVEILEKRGFRADRPRNPGNIHFEKYW
jgi:ferredoxin--NADP+ reductase